MFGVSAEMDWSSWGRSSHAVISQRAAQRMFIVAEVFPAAGEGQIQHKNTSQASVRITFANVPLTSAINSQAQSQQVEKYSI